MTEHTPIIHKPDPLVFRAGPPFDGSILRPTGLVHVFEEVAPKQPDEPVSVVLDRLWQRQLDGPVCGTEVREGCGITRLRHLRTPSAVDDGYVIGTEVTCPECLHALEQYGTDVVGITERFAAARP